MKVRLGSGEIALRGRRATLHERAAGIVLAAVEASCPTRGKVGYPTKAVAKAALRGLPRRTRRDDLHAYRCPCGLWHLGHKPGTKAKAATAAAA